MTTKKETKPIDDPLTIALRAAEKANFQDLLKRHICAITFTKVNGETRVMNCTLRTDKLPPEPPKDDDGKPKRDFATTVPVYDLDKNAWRSFRVDSLKDIQIVE